MDLIRELMLAIESQDGDFNYESVWKIVKEKAGSMAIGVLTQVAASAAKQQMGLS